jgi:hypothetical protein
VLQVHKELDLCVFQLSASLCTSLGLLLAENDIEELHDLLRAISVQSIFICDHVRHLHNSNMQADCPLYPGDQKDSN